ncbi:MAG: aspartate kinase, partial [Myxococcota bacterium]
MNHSRQQTPQPIVVQKYGGSSLADIDCLKRVARLIRGRHRQGERLCVVVSAMGDTTDRLLARARDVSTEPSPRELDMLLTCGERMSMALLAMALTDLRVPCISFTGSQSGILTDSVHTAANIVDIRPVRVQQELARGKVVIIAGFQGVSPAREITTLRRGGSDTTAVALAVTLGARCCEIYSDVAGVHTADPRLVSTAQPLQWIDPDSMHELASCGARVLNAQAVALARDHGIAIHARKTGSDQPGTLIEKADCRTSSFCHSHKTGLARSRDAINRVSTIT